MYFLQKKYFYEIIYKIILLYTYFYMKKILFIIIFIAFSNNVFADVEWISTEEKTECAIDWVPIINDPSVETSWTETCINHNYYSFDEYSVSYSGEVTSCWPSQQKVIARDEPGKKITCQNWDDTPPVLSVSSKKEGWASYVSGSWSNENVTITASCGDYWKNGDTSDWSGCDLIEYSEEPVCNDSAIWTSLLSLWKKYSNEGEINICIRAKDNAWNYSYTSDPINIKIDKIAPTAGDITSLPNGWYFLVSNSKNIVITWNDAWGSPIVLIEWEFEDFNNPANFISRSINSSLLDTNENISNVDLDREDWNYREYTYKITKICDEAWNCFEPAATPVVSYIYNVYAWNINTTTINYWGNSLTDWIADWDEKSIIFSPVDQYWNVIVPVKESNWTTIIRNLDFEFNYKNNLFLNQYKNTGDSWLQITWFDESSFSNADTTFSEIIETTNISNITNNDWDYILKYKVYSPTYVSWENDWTQFADWNFTINSINVELSDQAWTFNILPITNTKFSPQYYTEINFTGSWFIIWSTQSWSIEIFPPLGSPEILLEFWVEDDTKANPDNHVQHSKLELFYDNDSDFSSSGAVVSWYQTNLDNLTLFWSSPLDIYTKIVQDWVLDTSNLKTYLATHIRLNVWTWIDKKEVVYSSDVYWMERYAWNFGLVTNTSQRWVKIEWITHSILSEDLVTWSGWDSFITIWNLNKAILRKDIRQKAYNLIKEVNTATAEPYLIDDLDFNDWDGKWIELDNGNILYFWELNNWKLVNIELSSGYNWSKTLLIEWWDLFIKSNIIANSSDDILWIIVLKDENWDGWNIYIAPDVSEIDAIIYTDKVIASSDSSIVIATQEPDRILSPDNWWTYERLKNQLYVYWSIFSNNTIWWSVNLSDLKCPYYITNTCDLDNAQKYDMNYIRRWFENKKSGTDDYTFIIKYNPTIQLAPPPLFGK